jgi:hypothetical protein
MNSMTKLGTLMAMLLAAGCSSKAANETSTDSGADDATADAGDEGGDADASGCVYPAGPYGVTVGKVLPPTLSWQGFAPGATAASTVKITDLYDCDGSKGINAILIDNAAQWCVACQEIAPEIPHWFSSAGENWAKLGVQINQLIIENNDYEPATLTTAQQWRDMFNLTEIYVVADPNTTFPAEQLPHEFLVDPRSMTITRDLDTDPESDLNADGSDTNVTALAKKNAASAAAADGDK